MQNIPMQIFYLYYNIPMELRGKYIINYTINKPSVQTCGEKRLWIRFI